MADPSFTIREWCQLRRMSRSKFYELDAEGKAPRTYNVGVKRVISPEADRDWIREREAEKAGDSAGSWAEPLNDAAIP
jgi:predicted DNA-binding transcriptional regulator AlpA